MDSTGQPGPLVLQVDALNDDSDRTEGEVDFNLWVNGYAAFLRRAEPATGRSPWGCGQWGVVQAAMWSPPVLLKDHAGTAILSTEPMPAVENYGVRQVLLSHDNRSMLPDSGVDMVSQQSGEQLASQWDRMGFTVIADRDDASGADLRTRLPFLAFGMTYEAVVWAESRAGTPPHELAATDAPYLLNAGVDLGTLLDGHNDRRRLRYLRRVPVSAPRVRVHDPIQTHAEGTTSIEWTPLTASRHLELAHTAWPPDPDADGEPAPVFVLASTSGLPTAVVDSPGDELTNWAGVDLKLMPPSCTWALYDRWVGYDHATGGDEGVKKKWSDWRSRIHSTELLVNAMRSTRGQDQAQAAKEWERINAALSADEAQLDDPAVDALVIEWFPLRSDQTKPELRLLELVRPEQPPKPTLIQEGDPKADEKLLHERGRAGPADRMLRIEVDNDGVNRFSDPDKNNPTLIVRVRPGEIGEIRIYSAVKPSRLEERCALERGRMEKFPDEKGNLTPWALFGRWSARIEVATAHRLINPDMPLPGYKTLIEHFRTRVATDGTTALLWSPAKPADAGPLGAASLAVDNVVSVAVRRQVWHGTGRPLPAFPHDVQSLDDTKPAYELEDGSANPCASGTVWDAVGFAERFANSAMQLDEVQLPLGKADTVLHEETAGANAPPRYCRFSVQARHRYGPLYRALATDTNRALVERHFEPVQARRVDHANAAYFDDWIRAYRPGREPQAVPRPAVRLVVPLTRALSASDKHTADLLVVLDEELNTTSALATRLEAVAEIVQFEDETRPQVSPDPLQTGAQQPKDPPVLALECVGPLGHTFDTDTREPYFASVSYLLRSSAALQPWSFAKLAFRRVMAPELMVGYYPHANQPGATARISYRPTADKPTLEITSGEMLAAGQGHLTLQGLEDKVNFSIGIGIGLFTEHVKLKLSRTDEPEGNQTARTWRLQQQCPGREDVVIDSWDAKQRWTSKPSSKLLAIDLRVFVARIRESGKDGDGNPVPARWELALYAATSLRASATGLVHDEKVPWDRRWTRVLTWQLAEPALDEFPPVAVQLSADTAAIHGVAQAAVRASDYTPADWVQALPDATALPINGQPWVQRQPDAAPLTLRWYDESKWEVAVHEGDGPALLKWQDEAIPKGKSGQGLFHRLLVTRVVKTADGNHSEAYVGIFKLAEVGKNRFGAHEPKQEDLGTPPPATDLRGYVLLVQQTLRNLEPLETPIGFWDAALPSEGLGPMLTSDVRHRILGISDPIVGASSKPA